jgi:hypothetical protein
VWCLGSDICAKCRCYLLGSHLSWRSRCDSGWHCPRHLGRAAQPWSFGCTRCSYMYSCSCSIFTAASARHGTAVLDHGLTHDMKRAWLPPIILATSYYPQGSANRRSSWQTWLGLTRGLHHGKRQAAPTDAQLTLKCDRAGAEHAHPSKQSVLPPLPAQWKYH